STSGHSATGSLSITGSRSFRTEWLNGRIATLPNLPLSPHPFLPVHRAPCHSLPPSLQRKTQGNLLCVYNLILVNILGSQRRFCKAKDTKQDFHRLFSITELIDIRSCSDKGSPENFHIPSRQSVMYNLSDRESTARMSAIFSCLTAYTPVHRKQGRVRACVRAYAFVLRHYAYFTHRRASPLRTLNFTGPFLPPALTSWLPIRPMFANAQPNPMECYAP
ncbi:hypothetical protein J6590_008174, partial [Homalodisca vitripennis]